MALWNQAVPRGEKLESSALSEAAAVLEQLLFDANESVDRTSVRRAVNEGAEAWPGELDQQWWRWVAEAGRNLDLKCKIADCTVAELQALASDGARWILYQGPGEPWLAVTGTRGSRIRVAGNTSGQRSRLVKPRQLRRMLSRHDPDEPLRCVLVQRAMSYGEVSQYGHGELTPLGRLRKLLSPERQDIYILVIYALVTGLLTLATPVAVESLVNTVAFGRFLQPVVVLALMLFAFLGFLAAIRALQAYVVEIIQCRLFARVSADLAYRIPHLELEPLDRQHQPELVNRFFDVVTVQKVAATLLLDGLSLVLSALVGMIVLAFYHPFLLAFDVVLVVSLAIIIFVMGRGSVESAIRESRCKYNTAAWLEDLASCAHAFKYDGGSEFAIERADHLTYEYLDARRSHFRILMRQIIFALMLQAVASTMLLGIGGWLVISGELTLGQLVAAELIVTVIVGSFAKLGKHLESFYDLLASVDKLGHLFDLQIERQEGLLHGFGDRPAEVIVNSASCTYAEGLHSLKNVTVAIASGERVAVTGPSGSGKSLLLDLLFGIRKPVHGHLTIDGIDPRDLRPDVLRRHVVLVRHIEVFHGSVAENVHLARHELAARDVREALKTVNLLDDVLRLPSGLDTDLTSGGAPFSETQLRQLMLARAIVGRPGLLLVDGLLDALPDDDMLEIMDRLCHPDQPWTLVLVTGRRALADRAERVIRLTNPIPSEVVPPSANSAGADGH